MTHLDDLTPIEHWRTLDGHGDVLPWYTRPCLEWLVTLPLHKMTVFEFGCGNSTNWYLHHCGFINCYGVDDNQQWIPKRAGFDCCTGADYLHYIRKWSFNFDLIVIDGIMRDSCTEYALPKLKKGGYLIADNFEQPSADLAYWPKTRELTKHLPLRLYKEPDHIDWQSAVWRNV